MSDDSDKTPGAGAAPVPAAKPNTVALLKRFWPWMRPHRRYIWWMGLLAVASAPLSVISPLIIRKLIDGAEAATSTGPLFFWGALLVGLTVVTTCFELIRGIAQTIFSNELKRDLRMSLYLHMQKLSLSFYKEKETGTLMSRQVDDVGNLQGVQADTLIRAGIGMIMAVIYAVMLFRLEWHLALLAMGLMVAVFAIQYMISEELRRRTKQERENYTELSQAIHQALSGHSLVRAAAAEDIEAGLFKRILNGNVIANLRKELFNLLTGNLLGLIGAMAPTLIILVGVYFVIHGSFTIGALFAFFMYMGYMFSAAMGVAQLNPVLQSSLASLERIYEILDTEPEIGTLGEGLRLAEIEGEIVFENVSFGYHPGKLVLQDLNLRIPARSTVALVGTSGSGKSTLANLVTRFYDPTAGRVLLDGHDLTELDPSWLRRHVGLVPQEIFLFDRSVAENISYGMPGASREAIVEAARSAKALDFIEALPDGFDMLVGERGSRLSGGQRQRLAIAREMLSAPSILILDEATSALDSETEALIQEALETLFEGRTAVVIAHRLATVAKADMIIVMDQGKIVESGRHEELVDGGGLYSRLCKSQFASPAGKG